MQYHCAARSSRIALEGTWILFCNVIPIHSTGGLEDTIRQVLEAVVQLGGDGVDGIVDEGVEVCLELLLGHAYVEATL